MSATPCHPYPQGHAVDIQALSPAFSSLPTTLKLPTFPGSEDHVTDRVLTELF